MKLRGIEFGSVFCAPGARGFFGEGYAWHRFAKLLGMTWQGTTFAAKTTTLAPRAGNMALDSDFQPREFKPACIKVKPLSGHVLNAVGLSGPGAPDLFNRDRWGRRTQAWQDRTEPFMFSFMAVGASSSARTIELTEFVNLAKYHLQNFQSPAALQLNFACPNTEHPPAELYEENEAALKAAAELGIPLIANYNPTVPVEQLLRIDELVDAFWIANAIPWGYPGIDWRKRFGSDDSPLAKRGFPAGGLSGPDCLPFTLRKVSEARRAGIIKPIVAGNGIQTVENVLEVQEAGANAIAIGVVAMVRPWRVRSIVRAGNRVFKTSEEG